MPSSSIVKPKLFDRGKWGFARQRSWTLLICLWAIGLSFGLALFMEPSPPRRRHRTESTMRAYQEELAKAPRWPWKLHQCLGVCGALIWAMGNLVQAMTLLRPQRPEDLRRSGSGLVSFEGVPKFVDRSSLKTRDGKDCFYLHEARSEKTVRQRRGRWNTGREVWTLRSTMEYCVPFRVEGLLVRNQPTEIYGPREIDEEIEHDGSKIRSTWMPYPKRVVVMGRLIQGAEGPVVEPDPLFGMIISGAGLRETMQQEFMKGFLGLGLAWFYLYKLLS